MPDKKGRKEGNLYDKIFRENLEELILPILKRYRDLEIRSMKRLPDKLQTTTQRETDFLSEALDSADRRFILHVEFQSQDEPDMLLRMQEYHGIISRKYRLPVRHFVFYFGSQPSRMSQSLPSDSVFQGFTLLDFQTIDHRDLLLSETGSEIVLAILADFKERSPEAVIRLILQRLKVVSKSEAELKKYFNQLNVLSRLRNLNEQINTNISAMPITIDIEKDYLYQKGIEKGIEKGELKGEAKKTYQATVNMLQKGLAVALICEILEVSESYVLEIKAVLDL